LMDLRFSTFRKLLGSVGRGRLEVALCCCLTFWASVDSFLLLAVAPATAPSAATDQDDDDEMIEPAGLREAVRRAPRRKSGPAAIAPVVGPSAAAHPSSHLFTCSPTPAGGRGFTGPLRC
jgi:hypothetical protein